jgi:hypothetical protein
MNVTRVVTRIVDLPPSDPAVDASITAVSRAVASCGPWPRVGTLDEFQIAVNEARCEYYYTFSIADRYFRRFHRPVDDGEHALIRLLVRRETELVVLKQRNEALCQLLGPPAGSA